MLGLLGLVWAAGSIWLGAAGATWWIVPVLALVGLALYFGLRYPYIIRDLQMRSPFAVISTYFVTQMVTAGLFFLVGRGVGLLFA